jgi:hypothetical protein
MNILKMKTWLRLAASIGLMAGSCSVAFSGPNLSPEFEAKIDGLIIAAYQTAAKEFPCKMKAGGVPKMIPWQEIEKCLNDAEGRVDWEGISLRIEALRQEEGLLRVDVFEVIESALSAHAIPYNRVFSVNKEDALLPLSNTVLKFLPAGSLMDLPVIDKRIKAQIGTFSGVFIYERSGGLSASNTYKLSMFQFTNLKGDIQAPAIGNKLLLDSFGVPWKNASSQPGFRLTSNKLGANY